MMMKQVQRVILIVHLLQTRALHLDLVLRQVDRVQKGALKVAEVWGGQEGRKVNGIAVTVIGNIAVVLTMITGNLTEG
jgi:hypothetical protein